MKIFVRLWHSWEPALTWQEVTRLTTIETAICLAFIGLFEVIA
jgi:hypothetical protein